MEVDDDKNSEKMGFVPSSVSDSAGWRETLRIKYMCGKKCEEESFKFYDLASIVEEEDGKPQTIKLCRNCYDSRLTESGESTVTNAVWKEMIRQTTKSVQAETDSSWHNESPYKEELELLQSWVNETTDHLSTRRIS